jgi:hypothetical protein
MEIVNILLQKNAFILNREVVRKINLRWLDCEGKN